MIFGSFLTDTEYDYKLSLTLKTIIFSVCIKNMELFFFNTSSVICVIIIMTKLHHLEIENSSNKALLLFIITFLWQMLALMINPGKKITGLEAELAGLLNNFLLLWYALWGKWFLETLVKGKNYCCFESVYSGITNICIWTVVSQCLLSSYRSIFCSIYSCSLISVPLVI